MPDKPRRKAREYPFLPSNRKTQMNGQPYLLTKNRHFHDYAQIVRKKSEEYRFELNIKPKHTEKGAKQPILKPLFKVQLPGDLPSKSVFKCSNFLLSWRRIL